MISVYVFQSTHPRGVRRSEGRHSQWRVQVSIPAPTRGATQQVRKLPSRCRCFNPRTHEGCDLIQKWNFPRRFCFNPRTHEGCDVVSEHTIYGRCVSIHAPTRGATEIIIYANADGGFQSTHPRGVRRCFASFLAWVVEVSIHAPTRGATQKEM